MSQIDGASRTRSSISKIISAICRIEVAGKGRFRICCRGDPSNSSSFVPHLFYPKLKSLDAQ